jgi:hypothetical protein
LTGFSYFTFFLLVSRLFILCFVWVVEDFFDILFCDSAQDLLTEPAV